MDSPTPNNDPTINTPPTIKAPTNDAPPPLFMYSYPSRYPWMPLLLHIVLLFHSLSQLVLLPHVIVVLHVVLLQARQYPK